MKDKEIYFQKRKYSRIEIAEIFDLDPKNQNFKRAVITRFTNLGFEEGEDFIYKKDGVTVLWIPAEPKEKIEYLVRLLGIDKQIDVMAFSIFVYLMARELDIQGTPWEEKASFIKENYNIDVSEKTLRNWTHKLVLLGEIQKDKSEFNWWCTYVVNGQKIRIPVESEEEKKNLQEYREYIKGFYIRDEKPDFGKIWSKFGCIYYRSYYWRFGAWNNLAIVDELLDVVEVYLESEGWI